MTTPATSTKPRMRGAKVSKNWPMGGLRPNVLLAEYHEQLIGKALQRWHCAGSLQASAKRRCCRTAYEPAATHPDGDHATSQADQPLGHSQHLRRLRYRGREAACLCPCRRWRIPANGCHRPMTQTSDHLPTKYGGIGSRTLRVDDTLRVIYQPSSGFAAGWEPGFLRYLLTQTASNGLVAWAASSGERKTSPTNE